MDQEFGRLPPSISCPAGPITSMAFGSMPVLDPYTTMAESYNTIAAMRNHTLTYAPGFGYYEPPTETGLMPAGYYSGGSQYGGSQSADSQYASSHQSHASIQYRSTPGTPNHAASIGGLNPSDSHPRLGYTAEELCKVVVTSIQHRARQNEVASWIRHQIGEYSSAITGMEIPLVEPKGRIRGHAFITLRNPTAAEATVRILDQKLFQGRVVSTRLTTEGITDAERSNPPSKDTRSRHHRPEQGRDPGRNSRHPDQGKSRRDDSKHQSTRSRTSNSPPSSSTRQSPSTKTLEETTPTSGPVIAHGSSTRKTDKK